MRKSIWSSKVIGWMVLFAFFINLCPRDNLFLNTSGSLGQGASHAFAASETLEYQPPEDKCKTDVGAGDSAYVGNFCYTMSEGGKLIQKWSYRFKDDEWMVASKIKYEYVGMQNVGLSSNGGLVASWIYQQIWSYSYINSKDITDTNKYIAVGYSSFDINFFGGIDTLIISHDWDPAKKQWIMRLGDGSTDARPNNVIWKLVKYGLPDYKNKANSQRIIVSGKVGYKQTTDSNAQSIDGTVSLFFNDKNGPPLDQKNIADDGNFEFSYSGTGNSDIWVNRGKVNTIYLYVKGTLDYKTYEKFIALDTTSDFRWKDNDESTNILVLNKDDARDITLTESDKVSKTSREDNKPINPIVAPDSQCGDSSVFNIGGAILVGMCNITVMIRDWAMSLLCFAQDKLTEVLGQNSITSSACTDASLKSDTTRDYLIQ